MDPLVKRLRQVRRRLAVQQAVQYASLGLLIGASAAVVWVVVARLFPAVGDPLPVGAASVAAMLVFALVMALVRRPGLVDAALAADKRMGLKERLTSSLELSESDEPMAIALHADARRRLDGLNVRAHFPFVTASRAMRWAALPLVAFGLAYTLLPEFDLLQFRERQAEARAKEEAITVQVERLQAAVQPAKDSEAAADPVTAEALAAIEGLMGRMERGEITEKQALAQVAKLSDQLAERRQGLANQQPSQQTMDAKEEFGRAQDIAAALQKGNMQQAAAEAKKLQEEMRKAAPGSKEMEKLADNLKALAKLAGENSELGEALAKAAALAQAMESGDAAAAEAALQELELALEDVESIMNQLAQLDSMMANLSEWKQGVLGESEYCRLCGAGLSECTAEGGQCNSDGGHKHHGVCSSCAGIGAGSNWGTGLGLRGPGRGQGNQVGELPDVNVGFQPTKATGPMTKGRMLADILQQAAPEEGEEATVESLQGAFVQLQQEAEQALTREEIPAASKEYVRQYFGALEPEDAGAPE